jgi:transposase-like protein
MLGQLERGGSVSNLAQRLGWDEATVRETLEQLRKDMGTQRIRYSSVLGTYWLAAVMEKR